jgi:hypothetical protein
VNHSTRVRRPTRVGVSRVGVSRVGVSRVDARAIESIASMTTRSSPYGS